MANAEKDLSPEALRLLAKLRDAGQPMLLSGVLGQYGWSVLTELSRERLIGGVGQFDTDGPHMVWLPGYEPEWMSAFGRVTTPLADW